MIIFVLSERLNILKSVAFSTEYHMLSGMSDEIQEYPHQVVAFSLKTTKSSRYVSHQIGASSKNNSENANHPFVATFTFSPYWMLELLVFAQKFTWAQIILSMLSCL